MWLPVILGATDLGPARQQGVAAPGRILAQGEGSGPLGRQATSHEARLPVIPTIVVLLAVGTMIGLGVWQLQRLQ